MFLKLIYPVLETYWRIFKSKTRGARALIINDGKVLLIKHTYLPEWYLPGGGIKREESFEEGLRREIKEELRLDIKKFTLFGIYKNTKEGKIDTEKIFLVKEKVNVEKLNPDSREARELKFFNLDKLPQNTSPGTLRRINEYKSGKYPIKGIW